MRKVLPSLLLLSVSNSTSGGSHWFRLVVLFDTRSAPTRLKAELLANLSFSRDSCDRREGVSMLDSSLKKKRCQQEEEARDKLRQNLFLKGDSTG